MRSNGVQRLKAGVDVAVCSLMLEAAQSLQLDIERETQAAAAQIVLHKILRSAQDLGKPALSYSDKQKVAPHYYKF